MVGGTPGSRPEATQNDPHLSGHSSHAPGQGTFGLSPGEGARSTFPANPLAWQQIFNAAPDAMVIVGGEGRIVLANEQTKRLFGQDPEELIGQPVEILLPERFRGAHPAHRAGYFHDAVPRPMGQHLALWGVRRDGSEFAAEISLSPVATEAGLFVAAAIRDVTGRNVAAQTLLRIQASLREAHKMDAVGRLAAGIAHEINTPTQYAGDNVSFATQASGNLKAWAEGMEGLLQAALVAHPNSEVAERLSELKAQTDVSFLLGELPDALGAAQEGLGRIAAIVRAMKEFSHPGSKVKEATDVNHAIQNAAVLAQGEYKHLAELVLDLAPDLPLILCLAGELSQAILNLIVNATHAIRDRLTQTGESRGQITITTRASNAVVEVRVADTGTGIPEEIRSKIFEPFFTTKKAGEGTGQGLALLYDIVVVKHGGGVELESEVGKGSTFILRLPLAPADSIDQRES